MSAHCNDCGADIVYPAGTWPLGECPVCTREAKIERYRDALMDIADPLSVPFRRDSQKAVDAFQKLAREALNP